VVRELIAQLNNPGFDFNAIAKNVEKEPLIDLKVLRTGQFRPFSGVMMLDKWTFGYFPALSRHHHTHIGFFARLNPD
jgi:hypothetical protein